MISRRIRPGRVWFYVGGLWVDVANQIQIGGSLGWKTRGSLDPAFEKAAYELDPSTTGNPKYVEVKTGFGYHIIMVEGRK